MTTDQQLEEIKKDIKQLLFLFTEADKRTTSDITRLNTEVKQIKTDLVNNSKHKAWIVFAVFGGIITSAFSFIAKRI